jgi:uncharacterized membrane protein
MLRSGPERAIQTVLYEAGGLLVAVPLYQLLFGKGVDDSALLLIVLAIAVMLWSPLHNAVFDRFEWRLAQRLASDRPHRWRILHALSHEGTTVVVTLPLIMLIGGHSFWEALAIDLGLTGLYVAYAYVFHLAYDRWRPVRLARPTRTDRRVSP